MMPSECRSTSDTGFSIFEVLVAILVVAGVAAGAMDLVAVSTASVRDAREETSATALGLQKMEQLRAGGLPPLSPDDALERDSPGFSDVVDASGDAVILGSDVPDSTVYVRRWSVRPLPSDAARGRVLRVWVSSLRREANRAFVQAPRQRAHADVLLATVRTMR